MSPRSRRWLFAALALALAASVGIVAFRAFAEDELAAARRRVPSGADREAVEAAVGRPADGRIATLSADGRDWVPLMLRWKYDEASLVVVFDEDGRATRVRIVRWPPTRMDRFRAWLGW
jgi:hypothetical protein